MPKLMFVTDDYRLGAIILFVTSTLVISVMILLSKLESLMQETIVGYCA